MGKLNLSVAIGDYDRTRPLVDGSVQIDGCDPVFMTLDPEEIFFRAFRHAEFDVCELSMSSFTVKTATGTSDYVGIPAFVSRAFRHTAIYVRTDRIKQPGDLKGKRVGLPEYQLTACVWVRAILADDYGVMPEDVIWVRGGIEDPGRSEKIAISLPEGVVVQDAPAHRSLSDMLADGEIDAMVTPRAPSCFARQAPHVGWLFDDPIAVAKDYYRRTGVFPIMHVLGLRRELAERHTWLPAALLKAFNKSKSVALAKLSDTSATKVTLPFVEEQLAAARAFMGADFWSYGMEDNRATLETFLKHHHQQGLSARSLNVEELFHPATHEAVKF
ncbi:MAG: ABC transporter substrate-binding protein [Rhizobiaceae bacterium]|nr:MAG: ABC transporter substrate-binding protein [Rhizobiaceae bacterium]